MNNDYESELLDIIETAKSIEAASSGAAAPTLNAKNPYIDSPFNPAYEIKRMARIIQILANHIRYNTK